MKTKTCANISSLILLAVLVVAVAATVFAAPRKAQPARTHTERGYDPLELPADTRIVPKLSSGSKASSADYAGTQTGNTHLDSATAAAVDSASGRIYRIQIFTSNLFGEARRAATVAEEIFDQSVYLDYDIPYFKIRVGDFARRRDAEDYQRKVTTAGYPTALVVAVNPLVRQAPPLYDSLAAPVPPDTSTIKDTSVTKKDTSKTRE